MLVLSLPVPLSIIYLSTFHRILTHEIMAFSSLKYCLYCIISYISCPSPIISYVCPLLYSISIILYMLHPSLSLCHIYFPPDIYLLVYINLLDSLWPSASYHPLVPKVSLFCQSVAKSQLPLKLDVRPTLCHLMVIPIMTFPPNIHPVLTNVTCPYPQISAVRPLYRHHLSLDICYLVLR